VAGRLPRTFAALAAGRLHPVHVRIIEDETGVLGDQDAAAADAELAGKAGSLTFGQLRSLAHRLVLKLDPDAARKRKEAARQDAHVRRFREESGNAGMVARELPSDEVLASWQHVEQRALDLRAAGVVALDMETAAIAGVCGHRGIPWSVFRVLSDRATDGSVTEEVFRLSNQDGSPNPTAIAAYLVRHPGHIPTLARLARSSKLATERAASAAIDAVTAAHGAGGPHPTPEGS